MPNHYGNVLLVSLDIEKLEKLEVSDDDEAFIEALLVSWAGGLLERLATTVAWMGLDPARDSIQHLGGAA